MHPHISPVFHGMGVVYLRGRFYLHRGIRRKAEARIQEGVV
jgi:hypothetical protein